MKYSKFIYYLFGLTLSGSILASSLVPVFAEDNSNTTGNGTPWKDNANERRTERQQFKQNLTKERCDFVNQKISERLSHDQRFSNLKARIASVTTLITNLGGKYDTKAVLDALTQMNSLIDTFTKDNNTLANGLKDTQNFKCGEADGQFLTKLRDSKTLFATVRQDAVNIRTYFAQTLKPAIVSLREQIRQSRQKESNTSTTNNSQ